MKEIFQKQFFALRDEIAQNKQVFATEGPKTSIKKLTETTATLLLYEFLGSALHFSKDSTWPSKFKKIFRSESKKAQTLSIFQLDDYEEILHQENVECFFLPVDECGFREIVFPDEIYQQITDLFMRSFYFSNNEFPRGRELSEHPEKISPAVLDQLYQREILCSEQGIAHSGSFFSPRQDIRYGILMSLIYRFMAKAPAATMKQVGAIGKFLFECFSGKNHLIWNIKTTKTQEGCAENAEWKELAEILLETMIDIKVFDPTCGTGNFLVEFYHIFSVLCAASKGKREKWPRCGLFGFDLRPIALKITQFRLTHILANIDDFFGENPSEKEPNNAPIYLSLGDFLFDFPEADDAKVTFDFILGNPPYIRHRDIKNPTGGTPTDHQTYRKSLQSMRSGWKEEYGIDFGNRLDYSLYFTVKSYQLLSPSGVLSFLLSNSWMNVRYGYGFQEFLLKHTDLLQIVENPYRSFKQADINTVQLFLRKSAPDGRKDVRINFVSWKRSLFDNSRDELPTGIQNVIQKSIAQNVSQETEPRTRKDERAKGSKLQKSHLQFHLWNTLEVRLFSILQAEILRWDHQKGHYPDSGRIDCVYHGFNWGNYFFLAPPSFYALRSHLSLKLTHLGSLASISRGITTNCNDFFILEKTGANEYLNGYGDKITLEPQVVSPFLQTPRQVSGPSIEMAEINTFIFFTEHSKSELKAKRYNHALKYVEYGETRELPIKKGTQRGSIIRGVFNLASFKHRYAQSPDSWYCLKKKPVIQDEGTADAFEDETVFGVYIQKIFNDTYKIVRVPKNVIVNNTFYKITPKESDSKDTTLLFSLLLGTITALCLELQGRTNFGGGALDTATFDIGKIMIPNIHSMPAAQKKKFIQLADPVQKRQTLPLRAEVRQLDRIALDKEIFHYLQTKVELDKFYSECLTIQKRRLQKSDRFE